jgi:hypothetical protein
MNQIQRKVTLKQPLPKQNGLGLIQWLAVLAAAGFFLLFAFRVVPMYAENRYVISGLKSLQDGGSRLTDMTDSEIKKKLANFYMINNVRSEGPTKNLEISRSNNKILVMVDYETRVNLFYNIDLVLFFENHLDSSRVDRCCKPLPSSNSSE